MDRAWCTSFLRAVGCPWSDEVMEGVRLRTWSCSGCHFDDQVPEIVVCDWLRLDEAIWAHELGHLTVWRLLPELWVRGDAENEAAAFLFSMAWGRLAKKPWSRRRRAPCRRTMTAGPSLLGSGPAA